MDSPEEGPVARQGTRVPVFIGLSAIAIAVLLFTFALLPLGSSKARPSTTSGQVTAAPEGSPAVPSAAPTPSPQPESVSVAGQVLDAKSRQPVKGATLRIGEKEGLTNEEGRFDLGSSLSTDTLMVKMPGYRRVKRPLAEGVPAQIELQPFVSKGIYLTFYGVGSPELRGRALDLLARTELNTLVIDAKGDRGWIPYKSNVPLAVEAGANKLLTIKDMDGLMARLKAMDVYTVARIVAFKDNVLAYYKPQWAVIDTRTGRPWMDNEKLAWTDPFRPEVWRYVIDIAKEAAAKGFDEIQFDYIRFPTDGRIAAAKYAKPISREARMEAINGFLSKARVELAPFGVLVAADTFGYVSFNENDTNIGQKIEEVAKHVDYLSPMVYPSSYHLGIPGYRRPLDHPYEIVHETIKRTISRTNGHNVKIRPWIQDFRDYAFDKRRFGAREIQAQIRGAMNAGSQGWMLWDPKNKFTSEALAPKGSGTATTGKAQTTLQ